MTTSRRELLAGAGSMFAVLSMTGSLAACARSGRLDTATGALPRDPFLTWFSIDEAVLRSTLSELSSRGADAADVYLQHLRRNSISLEDGLISKASSTVDQGAGLRVVVGDQVGFAFTEDLSAESIAAAARTAASIASGSAARVPTRFADGKVPRFYDIPVAWSAVGVDRKLPLLRKVEELARKADPSITKVSVSWTDEEEKVLIATLDGRIVVDTRPNTRLWVNVTAERGGVRQSGSSNLAARQGIDWYTEERLQQVAKEAVDRTLILFEAKRPPAGELPVVLAAGASGILLHEAVGHGMEADFNRKGTSIYSEMIGKKVAPDFVTIVDDGTVLNERGALNVDDEGNPCERTVLVDNGILASYLHDSISARHYKLASTGSGRRESFRHTPMPRMRCTYMEDGPHTREEIIASVKNGIVAETFTNGQVQIGAGDFTFYIKNGWLIEDGKITAPIKDVNIIGNGPEALRNVTMAANDARLDTGGWTCGKDGQSVPVSQGLPTVLVSKMTVGGENAR